MKIIMMMMIALVVLTGCAQSEGANPTAQYCEMTKAYAESNGQWGWPDFNRIADQCAWRKS